MNKLIHFEIPTDDLERAKKFYGSVFGWGLDDIKLKDGMQYTNVTTVPMDENYIPKEPGAINGDLIKRTETLRSPVITINVDSIEEFLPKIEIGGGKLIQAKQEIPFVGYYAYFQDTEGNIMGLWENMQRSTDEK